MSSSATISIAMATYNGEAYLREQLQSLAKQTVLPLELQIGDDGSTDRTEEIVREFAAIAPFPVIFFRNESNLGYGENFLQTATRCKGDWIAFCDQDDLWLPEKLEVISSAIENSPNVFLIAHDAVVNGGTEQGPVMQRVRAKVYSRLELPATWFCAGFLQVFRRSLLEFPLEHRVEIPHAPSNSNPGVVRYPHDTWIPFLANIRGGISILGERLVIYRRHHSNVTAMEAVGEPDQNAFGNHQARYQFLADWYNAAITLIANCAPTIWRENDLANVEKVLCSEHKCLLTRAQLYSHNSGIITRIRRFTSLIMQGAYCRSKHFRLKSILKDGAIALVGPSFLRVP